MSFFSEDKVIKSAEGYGFSIGMSKSEVFGKSRQQYTGKSIYMLDLVNASGKKDKTHVELVFSEQQYAEISNRDVWEFYFKKHFRNMLRLTFEEDRLVKIYRHKKLTELP